MEMRRSVCIRIPSSPSIRTAKPHEGAGDGRHDQDDGVALLTLTESEIRPMARREILHARELASA
jgi:hypothetical protein